MLPLIVDAEGMPPSAGISGSSHSCEPRSLSLSRRLKERLIIELKMRGEVTPQNPPTKAAGKARERIVRLEKTIAEQAMRLHLIEGKDGWD